MHKQKFLKQSAKLIILSLACLFSFLNFASLVEKSQNENGELIFIKEPPKEDYLFKKFAYISGGINNPGVYEIDKEQLRLVELIDKAGGLSENADKDKLTESFNLSEIIKDSDHIFIPIKSISTSSSNSDLINLNSASISELDSLPGIGPSTAQKIIDARPFSKIEDLMEVPGIGDSKYDEIKNLVTIN